MLLLRLRTTALRSRKGCISSGRVLLVPFEHLIEFLDVGLGEHALVLVDQLAVARHEQQHEHVVAVAQVPGRGERALLVGQHRGAVLRRALLGHAARHAVGHHRRVLEVHHPESVDLVARRTSVALQLHGELLVLLVAIGVDIEDHQVLFTETGQMRGLAVQVEQHDVGDRAGRLLRRGDGRAAHACQQQHYGFYFHGSEN